jgi:hypothetical protein
VHILLAVLAAGLAMIGPGAWAGRKANQEKEATTVPPTTLGQAFARAPVLFSLLPAARFRVVVEGQQRELNSRLVDDIYRIGLPGNSRKTGRVRAVARS